MLDQGVAPENILALTFSNKAAEEMFGRAASHLMGQALDDFIPEATLQSQAQSIRRYGAGDFTIRQVALGRNLLNRVPISM